MEQIVTDVNGQPLFAVEIDSALDPLRGAGSDLAERTVQDIKSVGEAISKSCTDIFEAVRAGAQEAAPDELEVSFGVTLAGEAGFAVVKTSGEAAFTVTARWNLVGKS